MKKQLLFIVLFAVGMIGIGIAMYINYGPGAAERNSGTATRSGVGAISDAPISAPQFPPKVSDENGVTVTITPLLVSPDAATWEFDVVLSTHVQELGGYDLAKLATLADENGNEFKPLSWSPDATEGHHIGGVLKFDRLASKPARIEIKVAEIGTVTERSFRWDMQ